jgi:hypothetical protein
MIKVTIETHDIIIGKSTSGGGNKVDNWHLVHLINDVVRAFDKAETETSYRIRENLIGELSK